MVKSPKSEEIEATHSFTINDSFSSRVRPFSWMDFRNFENL